MVTNAKQDKTLIIEWEVMQNKDEMKTLIQGLKVQHKTLFYILYNKNTCKIGCKCNIWHYHF